MTFIARSRRYRRPFIHPRPCGLRRRSSTREEDGFRPSIWCGLVAAHVGHHCVSIGVALLVAGLVESEEERSTVCRDYHDQLQALMRKEEGRGV